MNDFRFLKIVSIFLVVCWLVPAGFVSAKDEKEIQVRVAQGDNLIRICKNYLENLNDWQEVARINGISDPNLIQPGSRIRIPARLLRLTPVSGSIPFVQGKVEMRSGEEVGWKPVEKGGTLNGGERIRTGRNGRAVVQYSDGSKILITPDAELEVRKSGKRSDDSIVRRFFIRVGRVISHIRGKTDTSYETPTAVVGIRGTDLRVAVDKNSDTRAEVLEGVVSLTAQKKEVLVKTDQGSLVRKGNPPTPPKALPQPPEPMEMKSLYEQYPVKLRFRTKEPSHRVRIVVRKSRDVPDVVREEIVSDGKDLELTDIPEGNYLVSATAIDASGMESRPTEPLEFRISLKKRPEEPPGIIGFSIEKGDIIVNWNAVPNATYRFQMASDPDFNRLISDIATENTEIRVPRPATTGNIYFRVGGIDDRGIVYAYSDVKSILPPVPKAMPLLLLVDISGSMQKKVCVPGESDDIKRKSRIQIVKELLIASFKENLSRDGEVSLFTACRISGKRRPFQILFPSKNRTARETRDLLEKHLPTDFPIFGRRTDFFGLFKALENWNIDSEGKGRTLVLFSDGEDGFFDFRQEEEGSREHAGTRNPITVLKRMKEKYGESFVLHTVYFGKADEQNGPSQGYLLMKKMAEVTGGRCFQGLHLLKGDGATEFQSVLGGVKAKRE